MEPSDNKPDPGPEPGPAPGVLLHYTADSSDPLTHTLAAAGSGQLLLLTLVPAILGTSLLLTIALMFWIFCRRRRRREDRAISDR